MAVGIPNFNRIIDITFLGAAQTVTGPKVSLSGTQAANTFGLNLTTGTSKPITPIKKIICPRHGRKPDIEINGTFTSRSFLQAFNITIKNLYLDLQTEQYERVKVTAGYEGNTIDIEGTILTMYQEAPGPDGKTVIQCQLGKLQDWLDATVDIYFEAGTSIMDVLAKIQTALKVTNKIAGKKAGALVLKQPMSHLGTARDAMDKLAQMFKEEKLNVFLRNNTVYAECLGDGDIVEPKVLKYMSGPPQPNTGGSNGTYYNTVTAPWMPDLNLFDKLTIPSRVYMKNFGIVGTGSTQNIQVTSLQFYFGTTGSVNSMTVQGPLV
ncbi:MAG: hypothetical protein J6W46_01450 [Spirochaetaceae bacterium]|nr:hypothetical protein [Spirochaetaceae bacterium]